jgi:hypothetical protein
MGRVAPKRTDRFAQGWKMRPRRPSVLQASISQPLECLRVAAGHNHRNAACRELALKFNKRMTTGDVDGRDRYCVQHEPARRGAGRIDQL